MRNLPFWLPPAAAASLATLMVGCPSDPVADTGPVSADAGGDAAPGMDDTGPPPGDTGVPIDMGTLADSGRDAGLPITAPTTFTEVVSTGFQSPTDAVASPDGATFYFAAFTDADEPAIFRVPSAGGAATALTPATGHGLGYPSGLVLSADGATVFIADPAAGEIFSLPVAGGTPTVVPVTGAIEPNALGSNATGTRLYFSGRNESGVAGVFSVPVAGGAATAVATTPFVAPTGLFVDSADGLWVVDHLAEGPDGVGVVFSVTAAGVVTPVVSGVHVGTPGGVSLAAGGGTAVVIGRDEDGAGQLWAINVTTLASIPVPLPDFIDPAGLRTARSAGVFAMVDSQGNAIYRGQ